jgi:excisionase family DNA binding protein
MNDSAKADTLIPNARAAALSVLSLRPRKAAKALSISERTLWTLTKAGRVPHVRVGRAVLYPVDALRAFLNSEILVKA